MCTIDFAIVSIKVSLFSVPFFRYFFPSFFSLCKLNFLYFIISLLPPCFSLLLPPLLCVFTPFSFPHLSLQTFLHPVLPSFQASFLFPFLHLSLLSFLKFLVHFLPSFLLNFPSFFFTFSVLLSLPILFYLLFPFHSWYTYRVSWRKGVLMCCTGGAVENDE